MYTAVLERVIGKFPLAQYLVLRNGWSQDLASTQAKCVSPSPGNAVSTTWQLKVHTHTQGVSRGVCISTEIYGCAVSHGNRWRWAAGRGYRVLPAKCLHLQIGMQSAHRTACITRQGASCLSFPSLLQGSGSLCRLTLILPCSPGPFAQGLTIPPWKGALKPDWMRKGCC